MYPKNIYAISASYTYTPEEIINPKIIIENNKIKEIGNNILIPENIKIFNFPDKILLPGFIDIHIHGAVGYDFYSSYDNINKISEYLVECGTTSFLATLYPAPFEKLKNAISNLVNFITEKRSRGAKLLGINLEGPYLNKNYAGALNSKYFREINISEIKDLLKISKGFLKVMTISPELKNSISAIEILRKNNVIVSLGHSGATFKQAQVAIAKGALLSTHTFNATAGFHHREPGILGAVFFSDKIYSEVIADGKHIHPEVLKFLYKIKNKKIILITDAIFACGLRPGKYKFQKKEFFLEDNCVKTKQGKLFGSILTMKDAVKNIIKFAKISLTDAVYLSSINPARLFNLKNIGELKKGNIADIIIVDKKLNICKTIIEGKWI